MTTPHLAHAAEGDPVAAAGSDRRRLMSAASDLIAPAPPRMTCPARSEPRPCRRTPRPRSVAAVLDDDRHRHLRVVGRRERGEPGVRRPPLALLRRPGLAGHLDAVDLGPRARSRSPRRPPSSGEVRPRPVRHTASEKRFGCGRWITSRFADSTSLTMCGFMTTPTVRDSRADHRHLQRAHPHVELPDRRLGGCDGASRSAGKLARRHRERDVELLAEAEGLRLAAQGGVAEGEADRRRRRCCTRSAARRGAISCRSGRTRRRKSFGSDAVRLRQVELGRAVDLRVRGVLRRWTARPPPSRS